VITAERLKTRRGARVTVTCMGSARKYNAVLENAALLVRVENARKSAEIYNRSSYFS